MILRSISRSDETVMVTTKSDTFCFETIIYTKECSIQDKSSSRFAALALVDSSFTHYFLLGLQLSMYIMMVECRASEILL